MSLKEDFKVIEVFKSVGFNTYSVAQNTVEKACKTALSKAWI